MVSAITNLRARSEPEVVLSSHRTNNTGDLSMPKMTTKTNKTSKTDSRHCVVSATYGPRGGWYSHALTYADGKVRTYLPGEAERLPYKRIKTLRALARHLLKGNGVPVIASVPHIKHLWDWSEREFAAVN